MKRSEILEGLNFRHACKMFDTEKKIDSLDFDLILESGRLAPSSMGIEPWKFVVLQNEEMRNELAENAWGGKKQIPSCSHLVLILNRKASELKSDSEYINHLLTDVKKLPEDVVGMMKNIMKGIEEGSFANNDMLLNAYSREQISIALANMMNTAALLKIDSCAIGGFDKAFAEKLLVEKGILDPNKFELDIMVAFGYRVDEPGAKQRQSIEEVVTWVK